MSFAGMVLTSLAYRPFLDPIPAAEHFTWPIMLLTVFVAAVVYRTLRHDESMAIGRLLLDGAYLAGQVLSFLIFAAALVWALVTLN